MPSDDKRELFLIDGNSLAYRAFFALPESIATADGRPTNAIYGFASMMAKLLIDFSPRAVIVAWDKGWSGREKGWLSSGSARQRAWWAVARARKAGSPPANSNSEGRIRAASHTQGGALSRIVSAPASGPAPIQEGEP